MASPRKLQSAAPRRGRPRTRRFLFRLIGDGTGTSATEFALIAPLLMVLLLGMSDVVPAAMAAQRLSHTTEAVGDLTGEYSEMQSSDMAGLYTAAADVLAPFPSATLVLRITSIYSDGAGHAYVHWSCGQGALAPYAANSAVTSTPTGVALGQFIWVYNGYGGGYLRNGTNTTFIMAESQYVYTPPAQFVIRSPMTMSHTSYLLPRQSSFIGFPWDGVSTDTPTAPVSATRIGSTTLSNGATCNYIY